MDNKNVIVCDNGTGVVIIIFLICGEIACFGGFMCLIGQVLANPYILYKIFPPETEETLNAPAVATLKLEQMGLVTKNECVMVGTMLFAVSLWIFGVMWNQLLPRTLRNLLDFLSASLGSDELKREYDALEEQKAKKSLKKEHFLWQLLNIEKDMEKVNEDLEAETRSREDVLKEQKDYELEESSKRREQAGYLKEITLRKKRIANKKSIIDKKQQLVVAIAPAFLFVFLLYKLLVLSLVTSSFSQRTRAFEVKGGSISHQFKTKSKKKELDRKREERGKHDEEIKMLLRMIVVM
ncbi:hypothetical protein IFM89_021446 [Coptis chinensis]|uniref:Uncharacterized protein n=1 Tax=Coptis chinensis TaxID=261450 RepID=A0A835IWD9_9MAGN|nr:hypothetical protein IFM89_021446 [Coptis chinensis]